MIKHLFFIAALIITINAAAQTKIENDVKYQSVSLPKDDSAFLALKDTAQKHLPEFINSLTKNGVASGFRFVVKSDFAEKGEHEHMWSEVYAYKDGVFKAIFVDSPFTIKNIKTGDKVTIGGMDIEDWAIFNPKDEVIAGNFSEKYLKSKE
nr:DUF2314 domain-containing protein [uncultured Mucilaginibacter sp.]